MRSVAQRDRSSTQWDLKSIIRLSHTIFIRRLRFTQQFYFVNLKERFERHKPHTPVPNVHRHRLTPKGLAPILTSGSLQKCRHQTRRTACTFIETLSHAG
jgi:hypothetical protein